MTAQLNPVRFHGNKNAFNKLKELIPGSKSESTDLLQLEQLDGGNFKCDLDGDQATLYIIEDSPHIDEPVIENLATIGFCPA